MNYIGKILPVDGYFVMLREELSANYQVALTHLYQPLIGIEAIALYQTLLEELNFQDHEPQTHHTLMNYLTLPLTEIYKARLKLEGIGLLSTLKKELNNKTTYTYELCKPFAPKDFFNDAMLSQLLYHHIGHFKYDSLRKHYETVETDRGEEITASFHDVFETFRPTLDTEITVSSANSAKEESTPAEEQVTISWLVQALKQRMIPVAKVLTPDNRKYISQLTSLYDLTSYDVEKALLWALRENNELDREEFKTACHDLFKSKNQTTEIKLTDKVSIPQPEQKNKPQTKEEMLIQELETMSPKQLLEDFSSGNNASEQDLKAVREVMTTQGLPSPVMNVLIHYVLLQTNMKLSKGYLEKIASHWSRMNLNTAKEAMNFAKQEKVKFDQRRKTNYRKPASKEVVPEWFEERKQQRQKKESAEKQSYTLADLEKEKARLKQQ